MDQAVYLDGQVLRLSHARLSPLDYGFLFGYGLFETMRAYSGRVFRLQEHLDRLHRSSKLLHMDLTGIHDLHQAILDTMQANGLSNARIRVTISGGMGAAIPEIPTCRPPTVLVVATQYDPPPVHVTERGWKAVVSQIRRNSRSPLSAVKSLNYLDNLLARYQAKLAGADEAVLLNEQDFLAEGTSSNIFIVLDNTLLTPSLDSGILPGITRQTVLEMASSLGIKAVARKIALEELCRAQEAFLTNSAIEIMPLTCVGEQPIGRGQPGTLTRQLMDAYKETVRQSPQN